MDGEEGAGGQECERSRKSEARAPFLKEALGGSGGPEYIVRRLRRERRSGGRTLTDGSGGRDIQMGFLRKL